MANHLESSVDYVTISAVFVPSILLYSFLKMLSVKNKTSK
jgi:hypothetical protein